MASDTPALPAVLSEVLETGGGDEIALVSGGLEVSYGDLRTRVAALAGSLGRQGLARGERVVVALPNGPSGAVGLFAAWRLGAVPVPLDARTPADQILRIARDCQARTLLCAGALFAELAPRLEEAPHLAFALVEHLTTPRLVPAIPVIALEEALGANPTPEVPAHPAEPDELALLAYTSGSTGSPKGVMHSHRSLIASLAFTREHLGLARTDRVLIAIPMHHLFALRVLLTHLVAGATVILERDLFAGLRRVDESRPNSMILVPAAVQLLVERFTSLLLRLAPRIRRVCVGSAAIAPDLLEAAQEALPRTHFHIPYGMTEARVGFLEPVEGRSERRIAAVDPGLELRVLDEDGQPIERGIGEIVLRGPALMRGYWHRSEEENRDLRRDGFPTRDLAEVAADGSLYLLGRIDDVISVGGEKVFPAEVENALRKHTAVADALVTGMDDPRGILGQVVVASVVLQPGERLASDKLIDHCRGCVEPYKVPVLIEQSAEIRRTEMGKIVRMPTPPTPPD